MKIFFIYTHHRRTLNVYYKRALKRFGHEVVSIGPWDDLQRFGTYGREPDVILPARNPPWYEYEELLRGVGIPDLVWLLEGGEDLRVLNVPVPFVHQSVEGSNMAWSAGVTPHRYVNFTCNGFEPPDVKFLPYGYSGEFDAGNPCPMDLREYDCVQVGSARPSRVRVWEHMMNQKDLNCWFSGNLWGPAHFALYQHGRSTFCNQTKDFMCPRVFDAMGMACLLISDRVPSILSLFEEGKHFIGYDPIRGHDGEGIPDPEWLTDVVRRCRREPAWAEKIAFAARKLVQTEHRYEHRVQQVMNDIR